MTDLETANFFRDRSVQDDPYPYFDARAGPVAGVAGAALRRVHGDRPRRGAGGLQRLGHVLVVQRGERAVHGVPRAVRGRRRHRRHRAPPRPAARSATSCPPSTRPGTPPTAALMMRLLTPGRLRENEEFMERLADRLLDDARRRRAGASSSGDYATPFTLLVVADLEGVPEADHGLFADRLAKLPEDLEHKPLEFLYEQFTAYIEDRRRDPRDDIMTAMATATFPDGSTPEVQGRRPARPPTSSPAARRPPSGCSRSPCGSSPSGPTSRTACGATATASRTSSRRRCATRARCGPSSAWPR